MRFNRQGVDPAGVTGEFEAPAKPLAEDGWHACIVSKVRPWKSRDGVTVVCEISSGDYQPVEIVLDPDTEDGETKAIALLKAALREPDAEIDDELVGSSVSIKTKRNRKGDGYFVNGIVEPDGAAQPAKSERRPAARTPAQKIARDAGEEPGGNDDIPFLWLLPLALAAAAMGGVA